MVEAIGENSESLFTVDVLGSPYEAVHAVVKNAEVADKLFWKLVSMGLMDFEKKLGKGAAGTVYKVRGEENFAGRDLALKLFEFNASRVIGDRGLEGEILALSLPTHPYLCKTYGVFTYDGAAIHYVEKFDPEVHAGQKIVGAVSRAIEGITLYEKMQERSLTVEEVKGYGKQLAEAILALHTAGVAHKDIHPENILIERGAHCVQLIDFNGADVATPQRTLKDWRRLAFLIVEMAPEDLIFDPLFYDLIYSNKHGLLNGHLPYSAEQVTHHPFWHVGSL